MRTLEKNKSPLWYVKQTGLTDKTDSNGFKTGEKIPTYSLPEKIRIQLYPANGAVATEIFGENASLDMIGVSELDLDETCLFFDTEPVIGDYDRPTYKIERISKSLNSKNYGFRKV